MAGRGSPVLEFLPAAASGVGELRRPGVRVLVAVALMLGLGATAACSDDSAGPVAPSPGIDSRRPAVPAPSGSTTVSPGPGVTEPGIRLTAVPRPDGSFDVTEDVMLPKATDILTLQLPTSGEHLPGMMVRTTPLATNLKVTAGNQPIPLENATVDAPVDLPLTTSADRVHLSYRLSGSTVFATPSRSVRAGAAIRPLAAGADGTLPTTITVVGELLNAVCPLLAETRCAVGDPPDLSIQPGIPAGKALVVLQLNLPVAP